MTDSAYWLEPIVDGALTQRPLVAPLLTEADDLFAIMTASRKAAKSATIENQKSKIENRSDGEAL